MPCFLTETGCRCKKKFVSITTMRLRRSWGMGWRKMLFHTCDSRIISPMVIVCYRAFQSNNNSTSPREPRSPEHTAEEHAARGELAGNPGRQEAGKLPWAQQSTGPGPQVPRLRLRRRRQDRSTDLFLPERACFCRLPIGRRRRCEWHNAPGVAAPDPRS